MSAASSDVEVVGALLDLFHQAVIADNYATHKHPAVQEWLAKHPRFNMRFTPTSAVPPPSLDEQRRMSEFEQFRCAAMPYSGSRSSSLDATAMSRQSSAGSVSPLALRCRMTAAVDVRA